MTMIQKSKVAFLRTRWEMNIPSLHPQKVLRPLRLLRHLPKCRYRNLRPPLPLLIALLKMKIESQRTYRQKKNGSKQETTGMLIYMQHYINLYVFFKIIFCLKVKSCLNYSVPVVEILDSDSSYSDSESEGKEHEGIWETNKDNLLSEFGSTSVTSGMNSIY